MSQANQPGTVDHLTELYRRTIVENAVKPVGYRENIKPTHRAELFNPLCGDRIEMHLRLTGDTIGAAAFHGEACAICMASASLLCANLSGRPVAELTEAHAWLDDALHHGKQEPVIEALMPLLGVSAYPSRIKCALLPWEAASGAVSDP